MLSEVLKEMVPVLLSVAVSRLLAGELHWIRGAGLSRLVSIPVVHPPHHYLCVYCRGATMLTRHPKHTARPTAGVAPGRKAWQCAEELCSRRLCIQGFLVPCDKCDRCEGPQRWWLPVRSC